MKELFIQVIIGMIAAGVTGYIGLRAKAWRCRSVIKGDPDFKLNAKIASMWNDGFIELHDVVITKIRLTSHGWGSRVHIVGTCAETGHRVRRALPLLKFMKFDRFYVHNDRRKKCSDSQSKSS